MNVKKIYEYFFIGMIGSTITFLALHFRFMNPYLRKELILTMEAGYSYFIMFVSLDLIFLFLIFIAYLMLFCRKKSKSKIKKKKKVKK